jgi:hypothetical protein
MVVVVVAAEVVGRQSVRGDDAGILEKQQCCAIFYHAKAHESS